MRGIKPPKPWQVKGKRFEDLNKSTEGYKSDPWTCSLCLTHGNLGPYCRTCLPEEYKKWREANEIRKD